MSVSARRLRAKRTQVIHLLLLAPLRTEALTGLSAHTNAAVPKSVTKQHTAMRHSMRQHGGPSGEGQRWAACSRRAGIAARLSFFTASTQIEPVPLHQPLKLVEECCWLKGGPLFLFLPCVLINVCGWISLYVGYLCQ